MVTATCIAVFVNCLIIGVMGARGASSLWIVPLLPPVWIVLCLLSIMPCTCLNSTYITISYDSVVIDHRPIKLRSQPRTTHFKKNGYEEIRVKRFVSTDGEMGITNGYELYLWDMRTNSFTKLNVWYKDLEELEVALFVAQEIKKYLTSRTGLAASATAEELVTSNESSNAAIASLSLDSAV